MSTFSLSGEDVRLLLQLGLYIAALIFSFYLIRLIRELIPTLRQFRRTIREMEKTIQNSQEILYNMKSISRNLDEEIEEAREVVDVARNVVENVQTVTMAITKPVTGLRNLLIGVRYGIKYLVRPNPSYEEEEEV